MNTDLLFHPFTLGAGLGLLVAAFFVYRLLRTHGDLSRYRRHLSDKLEIEADAMKRLKTEKEALAKENENLRIKVASLNEIPDRRAQRDLEVFARAERQLLVSVPGFASAWERAKQEALGEIEAEEAGRSMPKRVFAKIFGSAPAKALPEGESRRSGESG